MNTYLSLLKKYWGYDSFRGIQGQIIESIGAGKDTLGLMPTGGGKSITFQVPALSMPGICIVITPLIALMKDQVEALSRHGIKAAYIHSGMTHEQILIALDNCIFGAYKFLYISPERIGSPVFISKLGRMKVSFFTVDEAHCICQWGYDFRPAYLKIADIREVKPECPVLALTATATPEVAREIQHVLKFREENLFQMSFARPNLSYTICRCSVKQNELLRILNQTAGSCIVYSRNRQNCKELAEHLNSNGHTATYYHAGLLNSEKNERQDAWQKGKHRVMVATNAFGMGIDKADVRLIVHLDPPDSIEEYFQEAGRAGRDGKPAVSVIITSGEETETLNRRLSQQFPQKEYIRNAYEKLCYYMQLAVGDGYQVTREFNIERFCSNFHFHPTMLNSALEILDLSGYIAYRREDESYSRLMINTSRDQLFHLQDEQGERIFLSLLRNYGGIFVSMVNIDEELVVHETGLSMNTIYQTLVEMDRRGIVSYIPRKHIPHITFLRRRVETDEVFPTKAAYETRKQAFQYRLSAMQAYLTNTTSCRSKMLLSYFGEKAGNCHVCDICQGQDTFTISQEEMESIRQRIIKALSNGPTPLQELESLCHPSDKFHYVIQRMAANGEVTQNYKDFTIALSNHPS